MPTRLSSELKQSLWLSSQTKISDLLLANFPEITSVPSRKTSQTIFFSRWRLSSILSYISMYHYIQVSFWAAKRPYNCKRIYIFGEKWIGIYLDYFAIGKPKSDEDRLKNAAASLLQQKYFYRVFYSMKYCTICIQYFWI